MTIFLDHHIPRSGDIQLEFRTNCQLKSGERKESARAKIQTAVRQKLGTSRKLGFFRILSTSPRFRHLGSVQMNAGQ